MKILTPKARQWIVDNSPKIRKWIEENEWSIVNEKLIVYLWFYYKDKRTRDCHNYFKMLFDQLEEDGIVINDKFIIPRVVDYNVDKLNPRIEMVFKLKGDDNEQIK